MNKVNEHFFSKLPYKKLDVVRITSNKPGATNSKPNPELTESDLQFKISKWQWTNEEGVEGVVRLMALQIAIKEAETYMLKNHKDWTVGAIREYELAKQDVEFFDTPNVAAFTCRNGMITDAHDSIKINHDTQFEDVHGKAAGDQTRFRMSKFQGDAEKGKEGFVRMLAIKEGIQQAMPYIAQKFPETLKEAGKVLDARIPGRIKSVEHTVEVALAS